MRADTLFRLRRYSEASEAYALVSKEPDVRIKRARAIARAGEVGSLEDAGGVAADVHRQ